MGAWDNYEKRAVSRGASRRDALLRREQRFITNKLKDHLSQHDVVIDGVCREAAIINSDDLNIKTIISMPGEDIPHGGLVEWMGYHWLVTDKDFNTEVYAKGTMQQCNYLLRWVDPVEKAVHECWCVVEDGTKLEHMRMCATAWCIGNGMQKALP